MHPDSCESQSVFAGANLEAARRHIGRGRRWRIRSSLRMIAAASLIACSLVLHGCGGGGAPVATPEGGGPATMPPQEPAPPPEPTPSPDPTPPTPPTPPPTPPTPPPTPSPPPLPVSAPPSPPAPPPPDAAKFGIQSGDNIDALESILKSIDADDDLKPYLGGHALSYARYPRATAANPPSIRERHGLPATGSDFMDPSGLAAVFASESFGKRFDRDSGSGSGSRWNITSDTFTYANWVDGVFFGTSIVGSTRAIAPFVLGVPSGVNPAGAEGTAVWTGSVTGREAGESIGHLDGRATLTYDFSAANLDVVFDRLIYYVGTHVWKTIRDITWDDLSVSDGSFGDCSGSARCIRGRFFDDNEGNPAESVGGVFRHDFLRGAFGAQR